MIQDSGKMKITKHLLTMTFVLTGFFANAQDRTWKEQAIEEFKNEHYDQAVALMEKAEQANPNDAEVYFYLGWFNHYRAYDSRLLKGYDYSYSQRIFDYFDKSLALDPNYGDTKYFYGAECSANAFEAMKQYDAEKLKYFYQKAYDKGAYPLWLIEFGKNILNSCDLHSILFTGGNADLDICMYLQQCQNFRTDVTLIPLGYINRYWYVKFLKNGLKNSVRKISLNLEDNQLVDLHPFKWKTTDVYIPVSEELKKEFGLNDDYRMTWTVEPDLSEKRALTKMDGETSDGTRPLLSPQRAILLQIVEDNFENRPVFFTNFAEQALYGGLDKYFQNYGLVSKLLPFKTENTGYQINTGKMEGLLQPENLKDYSTILQNDIPRIRMYYVYYWLFVRLAAEYEKQTEKVEKIINRYQSKIMIGFDKENEAYYLKEIEKYK